MVDVLPTGQMADGGSLPGATAAMIMDFRSLVLPLGRTTNTLLTTISRNAVLRALTTGQVEVRHQAMSGATQTLLDNCSKERVRATL